MTDELTDENVKIELEFCSKNLQYLKVPKSIIKYLEKHLYLEVPPKYLEVCQRATKWVGLGCVELWLTTA